MAREGPAYVSPNPPQIHELTVNPFIINPDVGMLAQQPGLLQTDRALSHSLDLNQWLCRPVRAALVHISIRVPEKTQCLIKHRHFHVEQPLVGHPTLGAVGWRGGPPVMLTPQALPQPTQSARLVDPTLPFGMRVMALFPDGLQLEVRGLNLLVGSRVRQSVVAARRTPVRFTDLTDMEPREVSVSILCLQQQHALDVTDDPGRDG